MCVLISFISNADYFSVSFQVGYLWIWVLWQYMDRCQHYSLSGSQHLMPAVGGEFKYRDRVLFQKLGIWTFHCYFHICFGQKNQLGGAKIFSSSTVVKYMPQFSFNSSHGGRSASFAPHLPSRHTPVLSWRRLSYFWKVVQQMFHFLIGHIISYKNFGVASRFPYLLILLCTPFFMFRSGMHHHSTPATNIADFPQFGKFYNLQQGRCIECRVL